jgi:hypothetical protein
MYPSMQSLTPARRQESIRPIFWSNRQKSYLSRSSSSSLALPVLPTVRVVFRTMLNIPFSLTLRSLYSRELGRVPQRPLGRLAFASLRRVRWLPPSPAPTVQGDRARALGHAREGRGCLHAVLQVLQGRGGEWSLPLLSSRRSVSTDVPHFRLLTLSPNRLVSVSNRSSQVCPGRKLLRQRR